VRGQQNITFGKMRASGAFRIIVHCGDYKGGHSVTICPALWNSHREDQRAVLFREKGTRAEYKAGPITCGEERFVCTVCGHRGADVRPLFEPGRMGIDPKISFEPFRARRDVRSRSCLPHTLGEAMMPMFKSWRAKLS
jgi:hypothetical protein